MEILIVFALIILNGLFAMSEIALVTARKGRMQALIDEGDKGAAAAVELGQEPTRFLSTVQIGITSIGILNGIIGEGALAQPVSAWLQARYGWDAKLAGYAATAVVVLGITYFSIVLGELVPKRLGQLNPEEVARLAARPLKFLAALTRPFVRLLAGSTDFIIRLFGVRKQAAPEVEEEIHALMREGSASGAIDHSEHEMIRNVFRLDDRQLGSLMVPRADIVTLDADAAWEQNVERIEEGDHTRFPVLRGGWHEVVGVVSARTLLRKVLKGEKPDLHTGIGGPVFVPETLNGLELLQNFRASGTQVAFVIDEYGEVLGMVTLRDVLEAITGEFKPRNVEDSWAIQREDGSWLLDGLIPVPELKDRLSLRAVPEEDRGAYHTLSGMMMLLLGRLPRTTDRVTWEDWTLEVVDIDGKRVDKVLATQIKQGESAPPPDEAEGGG